jgi:hypothetical protein
MRRSQRLIAAAVLIALSSALGGCAGGFATFDPTDWLDFLDTKKKLQGERKPVFPEGVPGLEQGVPKDLYKGSAQQQIDEQNARATVATAPPPEEPKGKRGAKARGKQPATAGTPPAQEPAAEVDPNAVPDEEATPAVPPEPKPKKIVRKRTTAPPPDQPAARAAPPQQSASPFPAPLPSTATR